MEAKKDKGRSRSFRTGLCFKKELKMGEL